MNIYRFLNSKDEAAYLKSINYQFNPVELSFLVYISTKATYKQKVCAWQEICKMENCPMPERPWYHFEDNIHDFLQGVIAEYKQKEKEFYTEGDCVYSYKYRDVDYDWQYLTLDELLQDVHAELDEEDLQHGYTIRKQTLHGPFCWEATFDKKHRLISIWKRGNSDETPHSLGFEGLWLNIPTPFRRGDILINKAGIYPDKEPFVLLDLPNWTDEILKEQGIYDPAKLKENKRLLALHAERGDYTDMSSYALFADEKTGAVYHDHPMTYLDFEYYRGKLDGGFAVLKTISNYFKYDEWLEYLLTNYKYNLDKCRTEADGYFDEENL